MRVMIMRAVRRQSVGMALLGAFWTLSMPGLTEPLPFNGIHGFSIQGKERPVIVLEADLPVRYHSQNVNADTIRLTLPQARLAQSLLNQDNTLKLSPNTPIQQVRVRRNDGTVELELIGRGLGKNPPMIQGGIALVEAEKPASTHKKATKPTVIFPKEALAARQEEQPAVNLLGTERIDITPAKTAQRKAELPPEPSTGPQIASIVEPSFQPPEPASFTKRPSNEAFLPQLPEAPSSNQSGIRAVMLDEHGRTVQLVAKNPPIRMLQIGEAPAYNTLFQEEISSPTEQFMSEALNAIRQNQFLAAERAVHKVLQLEPNNDEALALLGEIQNRQGQLQHACDTYQKAVRLKPGQHELRAAQLLTRAGKTTDAIRMLENALLLNPQNAQAAYLLGTLHEQAGHHDIAIAYLEQAAALSPQSVDILYNLGLAYEFAGKRTQAHSNYKKALALQPNAPDISNALRRVQP
ncbi:MAG TPA: tetratricopeptide repeat protein [Oculatellaceae cyanobacterium]|jgi:Flp pilus assembly protein TadD